MKKVVFLIADFGAMDETMRGKREDECSKSATIEEHEGSRGGFGFPMHSV